MKEPRVNIEKKISSVTNGSKVNILWKQFVLNPIISGISGFTLFFMFAIFLDFVVNIFNTDKFFTIDIFTVLIGIAGFLLAFGFNILESSKNQE